jgi:hypothetical protein
LGFRASGFRQALRRVHFVHSTDVHGFTILLTTLLLGIKIISIIALVAFVAIGTAVRIRCVGDTPPPQVRVLGFRVYLNPNSTYSLNLGAVIGELCIPTTSNRLEQAGLRVSLPTHQDAQLAMHAAVGIKDQG